MTYQSFRAMGTTVEVWGGDSRVRSWFETVESTCSRFRADSELSLINAAGPGTFQVSALMLEVLRAGNRARVLTRGLVDFGVGTALTAWGYDRSFETVGDVPVTPEPPEPGYWHLQGERLTLGPGTRIDLGGIAKGWTCDRAVETGMASVVSAGGDLRSCDERTVAAVVDPWGVTVANVSVGVGAMATSSVAMRRWKAGSREASHVIDPRSMSPVASPVLSATVAAATAVEAEAGAKAVLIHGADGLVWAEAQEWLRSAVIIWDDGAVYATRGADLAA
ncbi:MAG TPA: FAD:protein FMN transferase [Acidimicrobiia bacterium]|nr:FAD:protein FMN transferase [Acidimicrobiia bacterium]